MLFIYVEKMKLAGSAEGSAITDSKEQKKSMLENVKKSFKRLFGK